MEEVAGEILACRRCPRLVAYRAAVAQKPPRRFQGACYHASGVPGFGDPKAKLWIVGLAPAAHGANRTGRMFTGDRSGDWLYRALYEMGWASQPESRHLSDGLRLQSVYISAAVRCAPPANKPTPEELAACFPYLQREWEYLCPHLRVVIPLGQIAYIQVARLWGLRPRPPFAHNALYDIPNYPALLLSYHPSQQNTFTGRLTWKAWLAVFEKARHYLAP